MKMLSKAASAVTVITALSLSGRSAVAQLLSNLNFQQGVYADYTTPPGAHVEQDVTGTSTPIHQSASASNGFGGSISASFDVTDNGSVATLSIASFGSIAGYHNNVSEYSLGHGTSFYLTEPSSYLLTVTPSGSGNNGVTVYDSNAVFGVDDATMPRNVSGVAYPGAIQFFADWTLANVAPPDPISASGGDTVTLTFTAIPEPSAVLLFAIPTATLLQRRSRQCRNRN